MSEASETLVDDRFEYEHGFTETGRPVLIGSVRRPGGTRRPWAGTTAVGPRPPVDGSRLSGRSTRGVEPAGPSGDAPVVIVPGVIVPDAESR